MNIIDLTKRDLETIGTRSLEGLLLKHGMAEPGPLTIRFQQSSTGWRQSHGGPEPLIIPEYVPMCLCASIANLQKKGYTVTIESFVKDEVASEAVNEVCARCSRIAHCCQMCKKCGLCCTH